VVGRVVKVEMIFFIPVKGENQAIQGGWPAVIVQIQCFGFGSRGKAAG
jgi:hypothetical protein